jgi:hypothetical protein
MGESGRSLDPAGAAMGALLRSQHDHGAYPPVSSYGRQRQQLPIACRFLIGAATQQRSAKHAAAGKSGLIVQPRPSK